MLMFILFMFCIFYIVLFISSCILKKGGLDVGTVKICII